MKTVGAILFGLCFIGRLSAGPSGSNSTTMATPKLVWAAPTNDWPSALWIYKVIPQNFSPAVISNLVRMASFEMSDGTNALVNSGAGKTSVLDFESADGKRYLQIWPTLGYIEYANPNVEGEATRKSVGVPTDEEGYPIALEWLRKFGIDRSELASRPSTNNFTGPIDLAMRRDLRYRGLQDTISHEFIQDTNRRGLYFVRRVDGVNIDGITHGGAYICFGEHTNICELQITWPSLEPFELRKTLTPPQVVDEIRKGRARWRPYLPIGSVKRITIFGFEPFYRGQPGHDNLENPQRFVGPYVMIYASLGDGSSNDVKCYSEMPIFPEK